MKHTPRSLLPVLAGMNVLTVQIHAEQLGLTVHVHNVAKVPESVLRHATQVTSKVFAGAGVALEWQDDRDSVTASNPGTPETVNAATDLFVWLLSKDLSERVARSPSTAGSALEAATGRRDIATMFYDRIAEAARISQSSRSVVLGYLMAHEIGHLLLGEGAHEPYGLMRHTWELSDFRAAERGELQFLDEQASRIRAEVARRIKAGKAVSGKP
jgi:hypothetical protein